MPLKSFKIKYQNLKTNAEEYLILSSTATDENELEELAKAKISIQKRISKSQIEILSVQEN